MWLLAALVIATPTKIAVAGLDAKTIDPAVVVALEENIAAEAALSTGAQVVSPSAIRSYLNLGQQALLLGCTQGDCLSQASKLLDADVMISGTVGASKGTYFVSLILSDLRKNTAQKRINREFAAAETELPKLVRPLVAALFGVVGKIALWNQPPNAEVYLDGRLMGATPIAPLRVETPGTHTVEVSGATVTPWRQQVMVEGGAIQRVRAESRSFSDLEEQAKNRRLLAGATLGGAALAGIGAAVLWGFAVDNDRRLDRLDLRATPQNTLNDITQKTTMLSAAAIASTAVTAGLVALGIYLFAHNPADNALTQVGAR